VAHTKSGRRDTRSRLRLEPVKDNIILTSLFIIGLRPFYSYQNKVAAYSRKSLTEPNRYE